MPRRLREAAFRRALPALAAWLAVVSAAVVGRTAEPAADVAFFESKIRPLLVKRCHECHSKSAKQLEGGLALDTRAGIATGGDNGPLVDRKQPDKSLLLEVVRYDGDIQMPPNGKLPAGEVALLDEWIRKGAPLPNDGSATVAKQGIDFDAGRRFWSFQPLRTTPPPALANRPAGGNFIDDYLQAARETRGLSPAPPADRRTLVRRATFDLLGLPPSPEESEQFANDSTPRAYDRLLDRLLDSPHYGERWGRYWLDLARYADGNKTSLEVRGQAWLYRDWVVRALNEDLPYDEFVRRQLAADQIPGCKPADLAALGFLGVSPIYFKELKLEPSVIKAIVADEWEERLDALGRTYLGLSIACARCHDHKFDPIGNDDYYALAGVLASSRLTERFVVDEPEAAVVRKAQAEVKTLTDQAKNLKGPKATADDKAKAAELEKRIAAIVRNTPYYDSALAHALDDAALYVLPDGPANTKLEYKPGQPIDLAIQIRGNPAKLGRVVPRRFLTVLSPAAAPFRNGSGRLELAQAIVDEARPLSARVIVNRVWAHHFGSGLVETVSDFGAQGERPSHPELLDALAARFIENGWSLKWLHRQIMQSAAYRQSSGFDAGNAAKDPDNRYLWRMNRRRLDVEAWRDAMLAACGNLDRKLGGPPVDMASAENRRRTMYGRIDRSDPDDMLRLFDFPDPSTHAPHRDPTTTALQQLFVLNGPFMARQATALAEQLTGRPQADAESIVREAYRRLFGRSPADEELRLGTGYLKAATGKSPDAARVRQYAQALLGSNEFLFVD